MAKSDSYEYAFLKQTFNGTAIANISSSGGTTSIWAALHTADPGEAGSTAAEGGYAAYTRVLTDRSTGATGWSVTSGTSAAVATASPNAAIQFPQNTAVTTGTFTFFSVYTSSNISSSGMLYSGAISPTINFAQNVTPRLTTGSSITED